MPTTDQSSYSLGYRPGLDGLRGLAILLVVLLHAGIPGFAGGFYGVDLFFVLSGYLITSILIKEHERQGRVNLVHFYRRRVLRLFPALFTVCLFLLIFAKFYLFDFTQVKYDAIASLCYVSNWTRAFGLRCPVYLGHCWSLAVEEQFYLVWPVLLLLFLRLLKTRERVCAAALALAGLSWALRIIMVARGEPYVRIYNGFDTHADAMFIGAAAGILGFESPLNRFGPVFTRLCRILAWPALIVMTLIVAGLSRFESPQAMIFGYGSFALCSAVLIEACAKPGQSLLPRLFEFPGLTYLGRISYGLYLWHYPLLYILNNVFKVGNPTFLLLGMPVVLAVSMLSFRFVETPCLRLKHLPDNALGRALNRIALALTASSMLFGIWYFFIQKPAPLP